MKKEFRDFYAKDTRADLRAPESKTAMAEANNSFRLARFHMKQGRRKLAEAKLIFESPEQIEHEFQEEEDHMESPDDPELEGVLAELDALAGGGGESHSLRDPAYREVYVSKLREQERLGLTYPKTVEISFPPQITAEYGPNGVILDTREVLLWLAKDREAEDRDRATMYREIADLYYQDDEDEDYDEAA